MTDRERAFEELFRATYPRVLGYARTMTADAHGADDAVADAYAIAWRRLADVPADGEAAWLIGVTRRVLANQRRGRRRADALRERLRLQPSAAFPDPAERLEDPELRAALRALRPLDREALVLVAWFELTPEEAAAVLGVRPAALRMRLTRARRRMRAGLEPPAFPPPRHRGAPPMTTDTDPLERRLRDARPALDEPDSPGATAVLAEARRRAARPEPPRRRAPRRALRVAALAVVAAAVVVAWPGSGSGTDEATASPIALALGWFTPPEGTILHTRSTLTTPYSSLDQESWLSIDDPGRARTIATQDGLTAEAAGDGVYDRARNTIYVAPDPGTVRESAFDAKLRGARKAGASERDLARIRTDAVRNKAEGSRDEATQPFAADPLIAQTRRLLRRGHARVTAHDGSGAVIEIRRAGGARHTLRVDAEGRPLELRIDRDGETLQTTTWTVYEALPAAGAGDVLSVVRSHPDARVVRDPAAYAAAQSRLYPNG